MDKSDKSDSRFWWRKLRHLLVFISRSKEAIREKRRRKNTAPSLTFIGKIYSI